MPTLDDLPWQSAVPMVQYPGMLAQDRIVWTAMLTEFPTLFARVAYNVHVGTSSLAAPGQTPMEIAIAQGVGRKRIDVVADTGQAIWIIEVKPYGNHTALGQVQLYADLFERDYEPALPLEPVLIVASHDPDLMPLAERLRIRVMDVEVPELETIIPPVPGPFTPSQR